MKRVIRIVVICLCCCCLLPLTFYAYSLDDEIYTINDNFRNIELKASNVFSSSFAVGKANSVHGLLPAKEWRDPVEAGSGYVIYKLSSPQGEAISKVNLVIMAKVSKLSSLQFADNNLKIYSSLDCNSFTLFSETKADNNGERKIESSTTCSPCLDLYIKIEMNNISGTFPLAQVGVKLFSVQLSYVTKPSQLKRLTDLAVEKKQYSNVDNFVGADIVNNQARLHTNGYYSYPLKAKNGVTISLENLTLHDLSERDNWFSLALLSEKQMGNYANRNCRGLYFMFFRNNGKLLYNLTYNDGKDDIHLGNGMEIGDYDTIKELRLQIARLGGSYSSKLNIKVNGILNVTAKAYFISGESISNLLGEAYLCYGGYGDISQIQPYDLHSVTLKRLSYPDLEAPKLTFSESIKDSYKEGLVTLPQYTILDESNVTFTRVRLFTKDGKFVKLTNNRFVAKKGEYLWTFETEDEWRNFDRKVFVVSVK